MIKEVEKVRAKGTNGPVICEYHREKMTRQQKRKKKRKALKQKQKEIEKVLVNKNEYEYLLFNFGLFKRTIAYLVHKSGDTLTLTKKQLEIPDVKKWHVEIDRNTEKEELIYMFIDESHRK